MQFWNLGRPEVTGVKGCKGHSSPVRMSGFVLGRKDS